MAGDKETAQRLLEENRALLSGAHARVSEMLCDAASLNNQAAMIAMMDLGLNFNDASRTPPLQQAARHGHLDMVKLLIERSADATLRDPDHFATAIGFALHNNQDHVVEFLSTCKLDIFSAAVLGNLAKLKIQLAQNPGLVECGFATIRPNPLAACDMDWATPLVFAVSNQRVEVVRYLLELGADANVCSDDETTLLAVAKKTENKTIVKLVEAAIEGSD